MERNNDGGQEEKERRRQVARARWGILRNALLNRPRKGEEGGELATEDSASSKRAFPGFNLFTKHLVSDEPSTAEDEHRSNSLRAEDFTLVRYTAVFPIDTTEEGEETSGALPSVVVRHPNERTALGKADLAGFDNTGNICVWPSEEVLAHYCLQNPRLFRSKRVCELGAGLGLAGLVVASHLSCESVLITDGNDKAVQTFGATHLFDWPRVIWVAIIMGMLVCLFLHEYHDDLLHTLGELLHPGGEALIVAPKRGHTLETFVEKARRDAAVVHEDYDHLVWSRHQELLSRGINGHVAQSSDCPTTYRPDVHYPWLLRLIRP